MKIAVKTSMSVRPPRVCMTVRVETESMGTPVSVKKDSPDRTARSSSTTALYRSVVAYNDYCQVSALCTELTCCISNLTKS